jgi:starch synthase
LILDAAEHLIHRFNFKIQFLVGGPANMKEEYAAGCAHKMWQLRNAYPNCFWAAPNEFFYDGSLVNRGADFGLMPSLFEPGGIVQHEFFVGGTPVVAFKTGGLKDSVHEFMWDSEQGCGYTFEAHNAGDLIGAIDRAVGTFGNKPKYLKLRENAFKATMDGETVSRAWLGEFFRLQGKKYYDFRIVKQLKAKFEAW